MFARTLSKTLRAPMVARTSRRAACVRQFSELYDGVTPTNFVDNDDQARTVKETLALGHSGHSIMSPPFGSNFDPATWPDKMKSPEYEIANPFDEDADHIPLEMDEHGITWADFYGEKVVIPPAETTLEWVLSSPVDSHLFEELPIAKFCPLAEGEEEH